MATEKSIVRLGVLYSVRQSYLKRITRRLLEIRGGVEFLHRDPASRRRRREGKSQI
jgi:hypothetical protein